MRHLPILLLFFLSYSCAQTTPETGEAAGVAEPQVAETTGIIAVEPMATASESTDDKDPVMASIRQEYARIQNLLESGQLKKDSTSIECEDEMIFGQLTLYSDASGVVLATNSYSQGDHGGVTENYYLRSGTPFFLFRESGYWRFGGEMQTLVDGTEVPGTIDHITEERFYFSNGVTIKALTKAYEFQNGEEIDPNKIPNETMSHDGEIPDGYQVVRAAMKNKKVDCSLLDEL